MKEMREQGVTDISSHLDENPEVLRRAMGSLEIAEMNRSAIAVLGAHDADNIRGATQRLWASSPETFRRLFDARYNGAEVYQEETKLTTLDGRVIDGLFAAAFPSSLVDKGICLNGFVDATDRVRAQDALQKVQADFAHATRISTLGELTASIAHEVNQPLAAIATNGEAGLRWLARAEPDLKEVRELTTRIVADARRASDIIGRIRAMAARRAPEQAPLSLDEVIRDALQFLRHEIQLRGASITHHAAVMAPKVLADRTQLQQVIVNLSVNAMQAMTHSGCPHRRVAIRTEAFDSNIVRCSVEDSGPGITAEQMPRLFESFFTTKQDGMGMGLPICRSIIEAHGGRISADNESTIGGARFVFTLPAASTAH